MSVRSFPTTLQPGRPFRFGPIVVAGDLIPRSGDFNEVGNAVGAGSYKDLREGRVQKVYRGS